MSTQDSFLHFPNVPKFIRFLREIFLNQTGVLQLWWQPDCVLPQQNGDYDHTGPFAYVGAPSQNECNEC